MPTDDQQRLEALKRFFVLDHTESEDELTRLVRVAAQVYGVAYAALTLRDGDDEPVAAAYGFDPAALPPDAAFCARSAGPAIPLTVADASQDERFARNPLVHGPQEARFYAAVPLKSADGFTLGTLALLDPAAQELNGEGMAMLVDLGALVEPTLNLQWAREAKAEAERQREAAEAALEQAEERQATLAAELEATRIERDNARSDGDALTAAYTATTAERDALAAERDAATAERDASAAERDALRAERDTLAAERDALRATHDALRGERDALTAERDALATERDALVAERDDLMAGRDGLQSERDALAAQRDTLAAERAALTAERAALAEEMDALRHERDVRVTARDAAQAELAAAFAERDAALAERDAGTDGHEATLQTLDRHERLAAATLAAAERLATDPSALDDALGLVAPEAGATRAVLVAKTAAGPTVRAAWHAEGLAPLAAPGDPLDAGDLDAWADARGVEGLIGLPLPGCLVLLDAASSPPDEARCRAAFGPLAVALRRHAAEAREPGRSGLLAGISHEVRTALTAIHGYAEVLGDEAGAEARPMADRILGGSTRLLQTFDAVLDIARLEAAGDTATLAPVDVGTVVEAAAAPFRARADARDLAFFVAGAEAYAWADPAALSRALTHLLANAFAFTEQGGVRLRVYAEDDWVGVEVQDTGCGIAPELLPRLFDAFQRGGNAHGHAGEGAGLGAGLGLALTKRIVDLMGGEITVTSLKGQGSVFRILLPSAPAPEAHAAVPGGDGFAANVGA